MQFETGAKLSGYVNKSKTMKVIHLVPVPGFYSMHQGMGGHVAHAYGMIRGLERCGCSVRTLAAEPASALDGWMPQGVVVPFQRGVMGRQRWSMALLRHLEQMCHEQPPDVLYVRYSQQFAWWLPAVKRILRPARVVLEVNSFAAQRWKLAGLLESRIFKSADVILAISEIVADDLRRILPRAFHSRILVLPNGVDIERFQGVTSRKLPGSGAYDVAYVGILKFGHGLENIVTAARRMEQQVPEVVFHLVGDGPAMRHLQELSAGLRNFRLHGAVGFDQVPPILKGADVLLYTTSRSLAFQSPIKLFEYMASGRAIVAMHTPATEWLLGGGANGRLIPIGDVTALQEAILAYRDEPTTGERHGRMAAAAAAANHTWESRARDLLLHLQITKK